MQLKASSICYPMCRHCKARNPFANVHRLEETVSTDAIFANCKNIDNQYIGAQIYYGLKSKHIDVYGITSKGSSPLHTATSLMRDRGSPSVLRRDNAEEKKSFEVMGNGSLKLRINGPMHITSIRIRLRDVLSDG